MGEKWYGYTALGLGNVVIVRILEYLSARALLNTSADPGTGSGAAPTVGTSVRITGDIGVKTSLPVGDNRRFSASLDASDGPVFSLLLANGLIDALNTQFIAPTKTGDVQRSDCEEDAGGVRTGPPS